MLNTIDKLEIKIWKILGLLPVTLKTDKNGNTVAKCSYLWLCYGLLGTCSAFIWIFISLMKDVQQDFGTSIKMKSWTAVIVTFSDISNISLSSVIGVVSGAIHCTDIVNLYSQLNSADFEKKCYKNDRKILLIIFIAYLLLIILLALDIFVWFSLDSDYFKFFPSYLFHFVAVGAELKIASIILKIKTRFEALNVKIDDYLNKLVNKSLYYRRDLERLPYIESLAHISSNSGHEIENLSDQHWMLCSQIQAANSSLGPQALGSILSIFIHLVITPYFLFLSLIFPAYGHGTWHFVFLQGMWIIAYVLQLILVVWPCSSATEMANETKNVICKHINNDISVIERKKLETFLIELFHHETKFTACGLFDIDLTLITSVTGAVTTYLVILIQFQNSDSVSATNQNQ